jgi:hypothetical protein
MVEGKQQDTGVTMYGSRKWFAAAGGIVLAAIALAISPAGAQETRLAPRAVSTIEVPVNPTIDDARRLFDEGKWKDARKAYDVIVERSIASGDYEPRALEGRAQMQYITDDVRGAAKTFADLAAQASKFGDPETELTAHFSAALLYQEARDFRNASLHVPRIKSLLKSPVVAEETRAAIAKRIG